MENSQPPLPQPAVKVLLEQADSAWAKGNGEELRRLAQEALTLARARKDRAGEGEALRRLVVVYTYSLRQLDKLIEFAPLSLAIARELGNQQNEVEALTSLSGAYMDLGQRQKALEYLVPEAFLWDHLGARGSSATTLNHIGICYSSLGQPQKALTYHQKALVVFREFKDQHGETWAISMIGWALIELGQPQKALAHFQQAVAAYEELRASLGGYTEAKASFLARHAAVYYRCLRLLLQLGKPQEAFALAQKTKARSLMDLLAAGRVDLSGSLAPEERAQGEALRQQADTLNAAMLKEGVENEIGSKKRYEALRERLKAVESQLQTLTNTLYAHHPSLAQKRVAQTVTFVELGKILPEDTALLDYIVVAQKDVRLFVVTKNQGRPSLTVYSVWGAEGALAAQATRLHAACADPRQPYEAEARQLYKMLIQPAEAAIRGKKRLVICPDGALWDVPFGALCNPQGGFVGAQYELAYAYSATGAQASLLPKSRRKKPTGTLLAVANPDFGSRAPFGDLEGLLGQRPIVAPDRPIVAPDRAFDSVSRAGKIVALPGTQHEADVLKMLFPDARILTGSNAQEAVVKEKAGEYRFLHFATHGFVNDGSPLLSSIVLAAPKKGSTDDGFLTAREIYGLNLNAELTVLSACNTARGENRTSEGIIGLTWALFVAGCPTQVVSQWAVDDASTALLMSRFYENLQTHHRGKGAALKDAQTWLRAKSPKYAHPYYWAPFVLNGAWK